jgi:hypothetical protein
MERKNEEATVCPPDLSGPAHSTLLPPSWMEKKRESPYHHEHCGTLPLVKISLPTGQRCLQKRGPRKEAIAPPGRRENCQVAWGAQRSGPHMGFVPDLSWAESESQFSHLRDGHNYRNPSE